MKTRELLPLLVTLCVVIFCACARGGSDPRLTEINDIIETDRNPREALRRLEMIDRAALSRADRHYHDLLTVKAHDKAYDRHQSDSLMMDVIGWYNGHQSDPRYAEALYYGGRVCADMGDLPRALTYYEEALDFLPVNTSYEGLRGSVLSQTASILIRLRLYDEAIRYLEETLQLSIARNDTLNLPYDHMLLGNVYKHKMDFKNAERHLRSALHLSRQLPDGDYIGMKGEMAILKYKEGKTDSALMLIRGVTENLSGNERDYFRAYAADIYHKAGITDTAIMYARQSLQSPDLSYRISGYDALLSPELIGYLPADSLADYVRAYSRAVSESRNKNAEEAAIAQNTLYNYSHYRLANERLGHENGSLWMRLYVAATLIVALGAAVWYAVRLYRRKKTAYDVQADRLATLNDSMAALDRELRRYTSDPHLIQITGEGSERSSQIMAAIEKLAGQLAEAEQKINDGSFTKAYKLICEALAEGRVIRDSHEVWTAVSESAEEIAPRFRERLTGMSGGQLTEDDYRLACLMRLGFTPVDTARLLGLGKGAITKRRHNLCDRLFGSGTDLERLDTVIPRM